jgi:RNA polymerase sigma-70 factor (ECF subfamily)
MTIINLRKYYPELYSSDCEISVPDEVATALHEFRLCEAACRLRTYRNKAYYSLDCGDQIEREALLLTQTPHEILERRLTMEQLYAALASLPDKQAKRVVCPLHHGHE